MPDARLGAHASARPGGGPGGWPRASSARVGERTRPRHAMRRRRPACARACACEQLVDAAGRADSGAAVRFHCLQHPRALRRRPAASQLRQARAAARAQTCSSTRARCASIRSRWWRARTGRCCSQRAGEPAGAVAPAVSARSNFAPSPSARACRVGAPARRCPRRAGRRPAARTITWKSGRVAQAALRLQLLHQPLEGQVLVRVRAQRGLADARAAARGRRGRRRGPSAAPAC